MSPYRGTGWAAGRPPAGHAPAQYTSSQPPAPFYNSQPTYNANQTDGGPIYSPPATNQNYYGNGGANQGYFGGQQTGVELQQPNNSYQPQRGGDQVYNPPPGPPPGKDAPSFDPSSLTVPKLRSILLSHDISYPSSAKKPQLIQLFNEELKPRSHKILAARSRIRRTSKGITNMPSSQASSVDGDDYDQSRSMLPPPVPDAHRRKPRKSSRQPSEDPPTEQPKTTISRTSSTKHPRQSDTETSEAEFQRPSARKTRKSELLPRIKAEEPEGKPVRPTLEKSPFSDENPFQSGSSPLVLTEKRRKSAGLNVSRRKSSSRRRKTEGTGAGTRDHSPQHDGVIVPSSKTFDLSVGQLRKTARQDQRVDEVEAGEDFTPEEQLELSNDRAANGGLDVLPARKSKLARSSGGGAIPKSALSMVLFALLSGYAFWFRKEKIEVGFCGIGKTSDSIAGVQIPDWASLLQPQCEPCPQHAYCYEAMETRCEPDFVLTPHPLSLGGFVPLPPTCEPDGEKARKVKAVADKAVEELRERKAKSECGTLTDEQGRTLSTPEMDDKDLKDQVAKKRRKGMSEREFQDLWKGALGEMMGREEVVQSTDGLVISALPNRCIHTARIIAYHLSRSDMATNQIISPHRSHRNLLASTSLARIPLSCGVRRSIRLAVARYRIQIAVLMFITCAVFYARSRIITLRSNTARVPTLVSTTLDRLATQAALYSRGDAPESWISIGQLRDDVLRDEFSAMKREALWKRVRAVVEMNANVRASERELRAGDVSRVWEWIGNLGLADDAWAEGGRRSGVRLSMGDQRTDSFTSHRRSGMHAENGQGSNGMAEKRHWDEGRPIY
ncbi:MAG: hypothetical protein Q9186_005183 [Xanthomendoza sp. 1 TL-2023]